MVAVVSLLSQRNVSVPSDGVMDAVAVPSFPPEQLTGVIVPENVAGLSPTVIFALVLHPFPSIIETV